MLDRVLIEGLQVEAVIGAYDWERTISQTLVIDLEMAWDNRPAGESDDLGKALDYAAVSEAVTSFFASHQPQLLESAAEQLVEQLRSEFSIPWLMLTLRKPGAVTQAKSVGIRIERGTLPERGIQS